jgi:hypothetical protein
MGSIFDQKYDPVCKLSNVAAADGAPSPAAVASALPPLVVTLDRLPRKDRDLVRDMAAAADAHPGTMVQEIVRSYLGLVRSAPAALPNNPLRRLTQAAIRKGPNRHG